MGVERWIVRESFIAAVLQPAARAVPAPPRR